jgi:hypothetical protein
MFDISGSQLTVTDRAGDYMILRGGPPRSPFAVETRDSVILLTREDLRALIDHGEALLEATKALSDIELTSTTGRHFGIGLSRVGNVTVAPQDGAGGFVIDPKSTRTLRDYLTACLEYSA